jgi:signal transduction histidine kinase
MRMTELHDGRFLIESKPGAGTTVTVCLPQALIPM